MVDKISQNPIQPPKGFGLQAGFNANLNSVYPEATFIGAALGGEYKIKSDSSGQSVRGTASLGFGTNSVNSFAPALRAEVGMGYNIPIAEYTGEKGTVTTSVDLSAKWNYQYNTNKTHVVVPGQEYSGTKDSWYDNPNTGEHVVVHNVVNGKTSDVELLDDNQYLSASARAMFNTNIRRNNNVEINFGLGAELSGSTNNGLTLESSAIYDPVQIAPGENTTMIINNVEHISVSNNKTMLGAGPVAKVDLQVDNVMLGAEVGGIIPIKGNVTGPQSYVNTRVGYNFQPKQKPELPKATGIDLEG